MNKTTLNTKLAALWLSEAWGEDIPQSHIRVRKGWIFLRYPKYIDDKNSIYDPTWDEVGYRQIRQGWEDEVDCIPAPLPHPTKPGMVISSDIYGEPWSDVRYLDSPFIPHNHERVTEAIAILDKEYQEYLEEYNYEYEDRSRRDGAENEYLIQENARLRRELNELKAKIERSKQ